MGGTLLYLLVLVGLPIWGTRYTGCMVYTSNWEGLAKYVICFTFICLMFFIDIFCTMGYQSGMVALV